MVHPRNCIIKEEDLRIRIVQGVLSLSIVGALLSSPAYAADDTVRVVASNLSNPTGIAVAANGDVYWTCTSAGVIVAAQRQRRERDED